MGAQTSFLAYEPQLKMTFIKTVGYGGKDDQHVGVSGQAVNSKRCTVYSADKDIDPDLDSLFTVNRKLVTALNELARGRKTDPGPGWGGGKTPFTW
jgi:hypothetical protein